MEDFGTSDIRHLVNLLNLDENGNSDEDSDIYPIRTQNPYSMISNTTPANCVNVELAEQPKNSYGNKSAISKDIWSEDEILPEDYDESQIKEKPEHEMVYHQKVTPDDIILQLDGKGPGTNSCECLLVKIQLHGTNSKDDITLKISSLSLICKTEKYYLNLDLPRQVDPSKCVSTWNVLDCLLSVNLTFEEKGVLDF
ncbi:hypothetical protein JTE90_012274 [Oedothorax gibbosus]|uniref:PIH1D1/2/3 CS-like domain-containing protein n=1 Tax=Oedothorax gibbosus TaxID=931172 RepID=A0AAV6VIY5_9ARAC|nr:hypothetical protein JTE90_012274 [Oedothorax gibbosus]